MGLTSFAGRALRAHPAVPPCANIGVATSGKPHDIGTSI